MLIYTKKYSNNDYIIKEIKVEKFPVVIITDTHTNISNINRLKKLYPYNQFVCLGDITFAFDKKTKRNSQSIQYFKHKKIPCLVGNHDEFVADCGDFDVTIEEKEFLNSLPIGFKLLLPDGSNYLCFHNRPKDLWSFTEEAFKEFAFLETYPINDKTKAVLIGHNHRHFTIDFPNTSAKLICIGRLSKEGEYALLNKEGIEFKKI